MKKIKNYTSIWNVEKMIYALSDVQLPFPVSLTQMAWFIFLLFAMILFKHMPPVSLIDNMLVKYLVIPGGVTWFISQKTFDGKKPYSFLRSAFLYMLRPKETYAGRPVRTRNVTINEAITAVRSEMCEAVSISNKIYRK